MNSTLGCLGNALWFILGGFVMGLVWWMFGVLCFISIIGIPWGRACFVMGNFTFFPFGKMPVSREVLTGQPDVGTGMLGTVGNILWLVFAGIWIALGHLVSAAACAVTIIGIPFAWPFAPSAKPLYPLRWPRLQKRPPPCAVTKSRNSAGIRQRTQGQEQNHDGKNGVAPGYFS